MLTYREFLLEYATLPQTAVRHIKTVDNGNAQVFEIHTGFAKKIFLKKINFGGSVTWHVQEGGVGNFLAVDKSDYYKSLKEIERDYPVLHGISDMEILKR